MARGHEPEEFLDPREPHNAGERDAQIGPRNGDSRQQEPDQQRQPETIDLNPETGRSPELRKIYEVRGRTYRLRPSEIRTMLEIGKFRTLALEDLREFIYTGKNPSWRPDVENLVRQGLVQMKTIPHEEWGSRQLLALTRPGLRFLTEQQAAGKDQALYSGFAKPREAHHDADLYRLYQKAADKIERAGGKHLRVVLDYELKKRVYRDLVKLGPARTSPESRRTVAERHGLSVVREKIPLPDVRIEYETPEGAMARVDVELATGHYRARTLAEKVRAGFSIYARVGDVPNLRRVLEQHELTAEILSL